ncbi:MAG TPA: ABC transporter permease, partial [bacterium]|nr:ABC transporter permease [bacterium]
LVSERQDGSFRRLLTAPAGAGQILIGKLLGRLFTATIQVVLLFVSGYFLFGVHPGHALPGLALLSGSFVLCAAAMGLAMGMWFDNRQHVVAVGVPLTLGMAALGGCWWPLEIVGPFMQRLGMLLPTGWAMRGFHELLSFGYGVDAILDNALLLTATAIALIWLASRRVRIVR